jgi:archaellum component FlaC
MLSESIQLYSTADHGTSKFKDMIKQRDKQLQEAEEELDRLKQLNERLVWESRQLTEQADSHSQVCIIHAGLRYACSSFQDDT